jgi:molybdate transport system substrate-binding protein
MDWRSHCQYGNGAEAKQCKSRISADKRPSLGKIRGGVSRSKSPTFDKLRAGFLAKNARNGAPVRLVQSAFRGRLEGGEVTMSKSFFRGLAIALLLTASLTAAQEESSRELVVAAAADLSAALKEVADGYEKQTGVKVKLSFGASGALTQQIQNGAPFDIFFSADVDYPRQLISAGDADGTSLYQYAVGKLVLWVPADSALDVEHKGMGVLLEPAVKKISIANPQHAPYGRAAVAALKHAGLYERLSDRLVLGENVSQAAQFAESGNAQVGFVALAHAVAPAMRGKGRYWEVPTEYYPALAQGVVVLSHSQHKKVAAEFIAYTRTKEVAELLQRYGFSLPEK